MGGVPAAEDVKYGTVEGLEMSAKTLVEAAKGL